MAGISFPPLVPSQRSYEPGGYAEEVFTARNGAVTRLRYGNQRSSSRLSLGFDNISDANAALILANYEQVTQPGNWVDFSAANVAAGASAQLVPWFTESSSSQHWRYSKPPSVTSVRPGISSVNCEFVGELEGT